MKTRLLPAALLLLALGVYAAANAAWLRQNGLRCVGWPFHTRHFMKAAEIYNFIEHEEDIPDAVRMLSRDRFQPAPLHSLTAAALMHGVGKRIPLTTGLLNLLYFGAALLFIGLLAAELGGGTFETAWAMLLYALYPAVYGLSRLYGAFDFQIAALVPAAVWCLLRTRRFESRSYSLALGGIMALALLVKDTFAGYFGPVLAYAAHDALRGARDHKRLAHLAAALGVTVLATAVYYANGEILYKELTEPLRESAGQRYLLDDWQAYTVGLWRTLLSPPFLALFLAALFWKARRRPLDYGWKLLMIWVFAPWTILFFMKHFKQPSYFVPILPAAAILSAFALRALGRGARLGVAAALFALGIVQFGAFSFDTGLRFPAWYHAPDPSIVYSRGFGSRSDLYRKIVSGVFDAVARDGKNRILVLSEFRYQEFVTQYHLANWQSDVEFTIAGGVGEFFDRESLEEDYDRVLLPMGRDWDLRRYVSELHAESLGLARRNWLGATRKLEKTSPDEYRAWLERFLARFPKRERLGSDGDTDFWLYSKT